MRKDVKDTQEAIKSCVYTRVHYSQYDYSFLQNIKALEKTSKDAQKYADVYIGVDTETSKKINSNQNHICAFSVSIRAYMKNIVTVWGDRPSELIKTLESIRRNINADIVNFYIFNLTYDWTFIRKFCFKSWGEPAHQLNVKKYQPIYIEFKNGIVLRDAQIIAGRKLEKWANDLNVEHKKAVGKWDYNKLRNQGDEKKQDELLYMENDTLALVECLDKLGRVLIRKSYLLPYTKTGMIRGHLKRLGVDNYGHNFFKEGLLDFFGFLKADEAFHGGYCHGNRDLLGVTIKNTVGYDFVSSYIFALLAEKYPIGKWLFIGEMSVNDILEESEDYGFLLRFTAYDIEIKKDITNPVLQYSKLETVGAIIDNGRILKADYVSGYMTEQDLAIIIAQYKYSKVKCTEVESSKKSYLPRWMTDYIFELFKNKCANKYSTDKGLYDITKSKANSVYGMFVQKPCKPTILELKEPDESGLLYVEAEEQLKQKYDETVNRVDYITPYQVGVWCTAYALRNLMILSSFCEVWLYSDTDSAYGLNWDVSKINFYNKICKKKLQRNGYGAVVINGREFWLGFAETSDDMQYSEFKYLGAKRYAGRNLKDGQIHITVAGVPKKGAECLKDDLNNFKEGFVFNGEISGKMGTEYIYVDDIYIDEFGNETGDSVNLTPADYKLSSALMSIEDTQTETIITDED